MVGASFAFEKFHLYKGFLLWKANIFNETAFLPLTDPHQTSHVFFG
jgi:hypothetical protein